MPPPPEAHTPYVASSPGMPPPPEAHTPYLVSVGLVGAETTAYPPSPATLQPPEAQETPEVQPQRPSPHSLIHSHELARAGAAHRADVQALQAHQQAREEQLQAWCAAQLQAQLRETEQGRETLLAAAAEAQAKGAADAAQRQAAA